MKRIHPDQLSLFSVSTEKNDSSGALEGEEPSEELFIRWLKERAPMIYVAGANPHIVMITTFRKDDRTIWLSRVFVEKSLTDYNYKYKGKLKTAGCTGKVYRPKQRGIPDEKTGKV